LLVLGDEIPRGARRLSSVGNVCGFWATFRLEKVIASIKVDGRPSNEIDRRFNRIYKCMYLTRP
jgi:hypothetical protein